LLTVAAERLTRIRSQGTDLEAKLDAADARRTMTVLTAIIGTGLVTCALYVRLRRDSFSQRARSPDGNAAAGRPVQPPEIR
jgi:hypothetical protein